MSFKHRLVFGVTIWLIVVLACSDANPSPTNPPTPPPQPVTVTPGPGGGIPQPEDLETVTVAEIIDGDTIELTDGRRVRYIGMNTPERDQPYYEQATKTNRQLVGAKEVQLEFDVETFDRYGRTLAYVWVEGVMVNLEIISQGFANAFTIPPNVRYEEQFRQAEREAREAGRGLWARSPVARAVSASA